MKLYYMLQLHFRYQKCAYKLDIRIYRLVRQIKLFNKMKNSKNA